MLRGFVAVLEAEISLCEPQIQARLIVRIERRERLTDNSCKNSPNM